MDQEVQDARARLAAKFGKPTQIGGKGRYHMLWRFAERLILWYNYRDSEEGKEGCAHHIVGIWRR